MLPKDKAIMLPIVPAYSIEFRCWGEVTITSIEDIELENMYKKLEPEKQKPNQKNDNILNSYKELLVLASERDRQVKECLSDDTCKLNYL